MKLTIELVPRTSWFSNLRSLLSKEEWDVIRKWCYAKAGHVCEVCSGVGPKHPVECHEVWEYDEDKGIQKLIGLIALCPNCHKTKHYGYARVSGKEEEVKAHFMKINNITEKEVKAHFMKINNITEKEANEYINKVFNEWGKRNEINWSLDISYLEQYKSQ